MQRVVGIIGSILVLLLLCSCASPEPAPFGPDAAAPISASEEPEIIEWVAPTDQDSAEIPEPAAETVGSELAETEPAAEEPPVIPESEPEPYPFTEGAPLCVGGIECGTVCLLDDVSYLPLDALTEHLPLQAEPTDDGGRLLSLRSRSVWMDDTLCWETDGVLISHDTAPICWEGQWFLPLDAMTPVLGLSVLTDTQYPHVYVTDNGLYESVPEGINIPTLMYHAISDTPRGNDELFVKPEELEKQIRYLSENGYTAITFEDLPRLNEIEKPVMLTFDDGYDDNYTYLYPLLQKYDMKATIFVISGYVNFINYLSEAQINEMADSGLVSIQSHADTHPNLTTLDAEALEHEFWISWLTITRITGKEPFVLCYPSGQQNDLVRQVAAERYTYGLRMSGNCYTTGTDPFQIPRYFVSRYTDLATFASFVSHAG